MRKKILFLALILGLLVMAGANSALARGWFWNESNLDPEELANKHQEIFLEKANLLGITPEEMKEYWAQGQGLREIASEIGLNSEDLWAKMQEKRENQMKERINVLVEKGIISQEQAEKRLSFENHRGFSPEKFTKIGEGKRSERRLGGCLERMNFKEDNN
jgi:hypothetical protein